MRIEHGLKFALQILPFIFHEDVGLLLLQIIQDMKFLSPVFVGEDAGFQLYVNGMLYSCQELQSSQAAVKHCFTATGCLFWNTQANTEDFVILGKIQSSRIPHIQYQPLLLHGKKAKFVLLV